MSEIVRWSLLIFFSSFYPTVVTASENKVFLLLVDGLRYDAVSGSQLPGFRSLEKRGVWVERLIPNFPSVGYPNYFSLLTGLFPEYHGVTDDNMYDYETNSFLVKGMTSGGDRNGTKWLTTDETFPQTASKHDKNCLFINWPGCEMIDENPTNHRCWGEGNEAGGNQSINSVKMKAEEKFASLTRLAIQGLEELGNGTADVVFLFVQRVDMAGHATGPKSLNYRKAVMTTDNLILSLQKSLKQKELESEVNLIVLSAHGIMNLRKPTLIVDITKFAPFARSAATFPLGGPYLTLYPHKGTLPKVFNPLFRRSHRHIKVYWKWNTPEKWHLRNGKFVAPIMVVADPGWIVVTSRKEAIFHSRNRYGYHGWDPERSREMHGTFFAAGPDFKQNFHAKEIRINDVYNLLCQLIRVTPAPNNGSLARIRDLLVQNENVSTYTEPTTTSTRAITVGTLETTEKPKLSVENNTELISINETLTTTGAINGDLNTTNSLSTIVSATTEEFTPPTLNISESLVTPGSENETIANTTEVNMQRQNVTNTTVQFVNQTSVSNENESENALKSTEGSGEDADNVTHYYDPTYSPPTVETSDGSGEAVEENLQVEKGSEVSKVEEAILDMGATVNISTSNDTDEISMEGSAESSEIESLSRDVRSEPIINLLNIDNREEYEDESLADLNPYLTPGKRQRNLLFFVDDNHNESESQGHGHLAELLKRPRLNSSILINPPDVRVDIRQYQEQKYEGSVKLSGESRAENKVHFEHFGYQLHENDATLNQHFGPKIQIKPTLTDVFHSTPPHLVLINSLKRLQDESLDGNSSSAGLLKSFNRQMRCEAALLLNASFYDNPECGGDRGENQTDYGVNTHILSYFERLLTSDPHYHLENDKEIKSDQPVVDSVSSCGRKSSQTGPKSNQFNVQSGGFASQIVVDRPTVVLNVIQPLFVLQLNNESDVLDSADRQVLIDYLNGEVESRQKREANETNESESPGINLNLNQKIEVENEGNLTELLLGLINAPKNVANVKVQQYNIENAKFYQTQHFGAQETFNPSFNQIAVDNNPTLLFLQLVQLLQKQQNSFGGDIVGETSPQNLVSKSVDATENIAETTIERGKMTESHNPTKGAKVSLEVDEDSTLNQFNVETGGEAVQILVKQPNVVVNIRKPPVELISYEAVTSKMKFKRSAEEKAKIEVKISQKVEIENEKVSSAQLENIGSNQLDLQIHHYRLQNGTFTQAQHFGPRVEISPTLNQVSINHNSPQLQFVPIAVGTENDTVEWPQVEFESSGELPFVANNRPDLLVDNLFTLLPDEKISTVSNSDDAQSRVEPAGLSVNQFNVAKGGSAVQLIVENLMARVNLDEIEVLEEDSNE